MKTKHLHSETEDFKVIDFVAEKDETIVTIEYYSEFDQLFKTLLKDVRAAGSVRATINLTYANEEIGETSVIKSNVAINEILELVTSFKVLSQIDEEIYEEVTDEINEELRAHVKSLSFAIKVEIDE